MAACSDAAIGDGPTEESPESPTQPGGAVPPGGNQPSGPSGAVPPSAVPGNTSPGTSGNPQTNPTPGNDPQTPNGSMPGTNPTDPADPSNPSNPTDPSDPNAPPENPLEPTEPFAQCDTPGPRLVRRLTAQQYENTLVSLLGDGFTKEVVFSDPAINGFHVDADAIVVSDLTSELLMNYAEQASAWVIQNQKWKVASCSTHDPACHRQAIAEFGRRAFRQELTEQQIETYLPLLAAEETLDAGLHVMVSTMLQSPNLLYRRELGEPDPALPGTYRLTPNEIATQLAYFLTDAPPDDQLLAAAAEGRLSTREEIDQQVFGLLSRDTAKTALARFVQGWLEIDNLPKKAKDTAILDLTEELRTAMLGETRQFFQDLFDTGGTIADLFGADFTHVNQPLSQLYGFGGGGDAFSRVMLEGRRATGVLGHAAFLTEHSLPGNSSPVQRGVIVRERILCQDLPPVPENLDTNLSDSTGFASNRERYAQHSADPSCSGCHSIIDPIGFAFENYDAFGRYRTDENGTPIDATGSLSGVSGGPIALDGLQSLNDYLATSDEAHSCFIRYWSYYAYGRQGWTEEVCNHDAIRAEASADGYSLRSTLLAIIHSPHFTRRVAD
jgi:hypothetical protein